MAEISLNECLVEKGSDIENSGGNLVCGTPHAEGIPSGSYAGSCSGCRVDGVQLKCDQCYDAMGLNSYVNPVEAGSCENWGIDDGQLSCEDDASRREGAAEPEPEPEPEPQRDSERKEL